MIGKTTKQKVENAGCLGAILIVVVFIAAALGSCGKHEDKPVVVEPKSEFEQTWGDYFSAWDGSCIPLVKAVKQDMNDPKSFEFVKVESMIENENGNLIVAMSFRGKNAYGGIVLQGVWCELTPDGKIIAMEYKE